MAQSLTTENLVKHYFNICNTALLEHKDSLLFKAAMALMERFAAGDNISMKVISDSGKTLGYFTTYFKDGQFAPITEGVHEPDKALTVSDSFLQEVVENRDDYILHPQKLDWSWLTK